MKNFIFITILCFIFTNIYTQEQAQEAFKIRMNNHVANYIENEIDMTKAREKYGHTCLEHYIVHDEEVISRAADAEKHSYIVNNMGEYKRLFFPQSADRSSTDTLVCDNGGFEDDFLYYKGFSTIFSFGSKTCSPTWAGVPSTYVPATLPTVREIEIVGSGTDAITGLQKVKFGNKSLKLNDPYHHLLDNQNKLRCDGGNRINKIVKRFKVTEETRDFTVWYSLALENPPGHGDRSPFFSITCDLAPLSDLCFDSDILDCDSIYSQPGCLPQLMDVLDWTCHRIKIPASEIGNIATLEIVMADCGISGHNGYAYIDGICEECTGSALGSLVLSDASVSSGQIGVNYTSCEGELATICARYTEPFVCGEWNLDSIFVAGHPITNVSIDTINKIFCFDFDIQNFGSLDTLEIYLGGLFKKNGGGNLPLVFSNSIKIIKSLFTSYDISLLTSICYNNATPDDISDDYYFVQIAESTAGSHAWSIGRKLLDPYDNETGISQLDSGTGPFSLNLGPFLIQEGSWELSVTIGVCVYNFTIFPPPYCSGCDKFHEISINTVRCVEIGPGLDTWKFNVYVPMNTGSGFEITLNGSPVVSSPFNNTVTISGGVIGTTCLEYVIKASGTTCESVFTVCPPKPCSDEDCDLEVIVSEIECVDEFGAFEVELEVTNYGANYVCYTAIPSGGGATKSPLPTNGILGPFDSDVTIVIYLCPNSDCSGCSEPTCYKVLHVFEPDCDSRHFGGPKAKIISSVEEITTELKQIVKVYPNPVNNNELKVVSDLPTTSIEIFNTSSILVHKINFEGQEYKWNMENMPAGVYFLHYKNEIGQVQSIKFVKL